MGLFNLFKKKGAGNHNLTDESRELAAETRQKKALLRHLQLDIEIAQLKQELDEIQSEGFEQNPEKLLFKLLNGVMAKREEPTQPKSEELNTPSAATEQNSLVLSREQLTTFYKGLSAKHKTLIKFASDDEIKKAVRAQIPTINEKSLNDFIIIAREHQ